MRNFSNSQQNRYFHFPTLAIFTLLFGCGSGGVDSLVGEFADKNGGYAELKVINRAGVYMVAIRATEFVWAAPEKVSKCSDEAIESLFKSEWRNFIESGLCKPGSAFGLFKVKKGANADGHVFKSDYFAFLLLGGGEMYRVENSEGVLMPIQPKESKATGVWLATVSLEGAPDGLELSAVVDFDTRTSDFKASMNGQEKITVGRIDNIEEYENSNLMNFFVEDGADGRRRSIHYTVVINGNSMWGQWSGDGGSGEIQAEKK